MKWRGSCENIPDAPFVVVVPVNLVHQMTSELHRYLQYGYFDILPYIGTWAKRKRWWDDVWTKGNNPPGRKIVITTPSVSLFCSMKYTVLMNNIIRR